MLRSGFGAKGAKSISSMQGGKSTSVDLAGGPDKVIRTLGGTDTIILTPGNAVGFQINSGVRMSIPVYVLDSPATTSTITYSHRVDYHGGTVSQMYNYGSCNLTLMEIAQ